MSLWAPLIAATGVAAVWLLGIRGPDVPAQMYLSDLFRTRGWIVWNNGWYGGHYQFSYSVLFPPLGGSAGLYGAALLCATTSAWAFERLLVSASDRRNTAAVVLFAAGTIVPVAIGQLPFLAGEAVGLSALVAAQRNRRVTAGVLAASCALFSPVAAVFLVLAVVAWALTSPSERRHGLFALAGFAALPVAVLTIALPRLGPFPFWGPDLALVLGLCVLGAFVIPRPHRALRIGFAFYAAAAVAVFVVPNPLGGNVARLGAYYAAPLIAYLATFPGRRALAVLVVPLLAWQYVPALASLRADPSAHASYYAPLVTYLTSQPSIGRAEIPFTRGHWEAAFVAPRVPLARGWVRQLDTLDNSIFYRRAELNATTYHQWLIDSGITWVALPDVALDYSAAREAHLLAQGQPYLDLVWRNPHWRLWRVTDSPGLVSGPARVTAIGPDRVGLDAARAGTALLRVRYTSMWKVAGAAACVEAGTENWTQIAIRNPGHIELTTSILHTGSDCDMAAR
jgi:hypothetical protein